jgi:hypothetical protein
MGRQRARGSSGVGHGEDRCTGLALEARRTGNERRHGGSSTGSTAELGTPVVESETRAQALWWRDT